MGWLRLMFSLELEEKQWEESQKVLGYLKEIAYMDGCEFGEYLLALIHIAGYQGCFGKEFETALVQEINMQYTYCQEHAEIVEHEVTKTVIEKDLEWKF